MKQRVLSFVLLGAAVVLIAVHFVLDAGPEKEAPGWIIYTSMGSAVAATLLGSLNQRSRKRAR